MGGDLAKRLVWARRSKSGGFSVWALVRTLAGVLTRRRRERRRGLRLYATSQMADQHVEHGRENRPKNVTPSMPQNTAVPSDWRISAPAPVANDQRHHAEDEGERGHQNRPQPRPRGLDGGVVAGQPGPRACLANSTIRMAFFAARPTSTTRPISTKMLRSRPRMFTPIMAASMHIGTIRMTASGSNQLS